MGGVIADPSGRAKRRGPAGVLGRLAAVLMALALWAAPTHADDATCSGPPIWRAEADGRVAYLFPSVHLLPADVRWRTPTLATALAEARVFYTEIAMDPAGRRAAQEVMLAAGANPRGVRLHSLMTPEAWTRLEVAAGDVGVATGALQPLRPWLASMFLGLAAAQRQGFAPEFGVDEVLYRDARAAGVTARALETPEEQIAGLAGLSPAEEAELLSETARELIETPGVLRDLVDAWRCGDVEALTALTTGGAMGEAAVRDAFLTRRNHRWAQRLSAADAPSGPVLVVAGAAHMVGPDSLNALLSARGWRVARIDAPARGARP